jgi:DNA-binding beta-propeller fold protein YncE
VAHVGGSGNPMNGLVAMAFDNNSNLYYATMEGLGLNGVWFVDLSTAAAPVLPINVGYAIDGLAVDSIHGRLYISNARTNRIAVYSTSTWLQIGTIQ